MQVTLERDDTLKIVAVEGILDVKGSDFMREETLKLLDKPLIISMAKCSYVSSSGLRALMIIAKTARAKKIKVIYTEMIEEVSNVLEMTGFVKFLNCAPTIEEAIKEIEK